MIFSGYTIPGSTTEVTLCPLGDIQWNGEEREIAYDLLREHIAWCLRQPHPLFIGTGDYVDFASPSNREVLRTARLYAGPRKTIDDAALQLVQECYDRILQPTEKRWVGMVAGHHFYPMMTGGTTDTELCKKLGAPYHGEGVGLVRLIFRDATHSQAVNVWFAHGKGWGRSVTSPAVMLERLATDWEGVDVFLMGHHTKKVKADRDKMFPIFPIRGVPRLGHRVVHLVGTGGWQKGYVEGTVDKPVPPTYVEQALYGPVALGAPIVHIRPRWRRDAHESREAPRSWDPGITVEV